MANGLTALRVAKAKEPGRHFDGDGLYLQIGPNGGKAWLLRYQINGRERYMGLGAVKDFTLAEARERARKARQLLADGIDPIEARLAARDLDAKQARERVTFREAAKQFLAVHEAGWRNPQAPSAMAVIASDVCLPQVRRASGIGNRPSPDQ